jgi:uncharacterized protein (TIGR02266 family)
VSISKEKRKYTRVRPRGIVAHVRAPASAFACQVENLSAGGLFLRTEQHLPRGTALRIELVKAGGRKPIELSGLVAGVISPEEAATARFMPGLGVQFTDIESDEADRLEELLTSLGIEQSQAVVAPHLRRTQQGVARRALRASSGDEVAASDEPASDPEAILRDISEALEAEEAPLATSKPALPPQPAGPPPPAAQPQPSEAARLMAQIRGLLFQLADAQARLRQREAEIEELRAQLDDARTQLDQLQRGSEPRRMN